MNIAGNEYIMEILSCTEFTNKTLSFRCICMHCISSFIQCRFKFHSSCSINYSDEVTMRKNQFLLFSSVFDRISFDIDRFAVETPFFRLQYWKIDRHYRNWSIFSFKIVIKVGYDMKSQFDWLELFQCIKYNKNRDSISNRFELFRSLSLSAFLSWSDYTYRIESTSNTNVNRRNAWKHLNIFYGGTLADIK